MPFRKPTEARSGRWGVGLTAAKMKDCRWVKPVLVGQFEFTEWTPDNHLRHSRFIALRDDKKPEVHGTGHRTRSIRPAWFHPVQRSASHLC